MDLVNTLASKFNYTWEVSYQVDQDWGTDPKKNGAWGGVLGGVVNGDFDASFSLWAWTSERYDLLDFIPILTLRMVLASKKAMTLSI